MSCEFLGIDVPQHFALIAFAIRWHDFAGFRMATKVDFSIWLNLKISATVDSPQHCANTAVVSIAFSGK